jgi:hypothetical protein
VADMRLPMAVWPTDAPADGSVATEARWRKMARYWAPSTVLAHYGTDLQPNLSFPTLTVYGGAAWVDGHLCELATSTTLTVTTDGIVTVRYTPATNVAELIYRDGAGLVPVQIPGDVWEIAIARIAGGVLYDLRQPYEPAHFPQMDSIIVTNDANGEGAVTFNHVFFSAPPMVLVWFGDVVGGMVYPIAPDTTKTGFRFKVIDTAGAPYGNITVRLIYLASVEKGYTY